MRRPLVGFYSAVDSSGIVASIMGQAVSNVVLTGRLTIPMMKKHGYSASMAGAIEATASTAGQIMPPILGLAAFIIASFLNRPYVEVAMAAMLPGLLYMTGVSIAIIVYAKRHNLPKLVEVADTQMIKRLLPTFLISFGVVLWLLLGYRSPPSPGWPELYWHWSCACFRASIAPLQSNFMLHLRKDSTWLPSCRCC